MHLENHAVCLPSVISIGVLLPLSYLHVGHRPRRASVILFSHSTVGTWLHELLSSFKFLKKWFKVSFSSSNRKKNLQHFIRLSPTFPHATKWVLVGLIGTHSAHHLGSPHSRLVALGVGSHGVPPGKRRVSTIGKRVLQINATPTE